MNPITIFARPRWRNATLWVSSFLLGAFVAAAAGCGGGGSSTGPGGNVAGTYVLQNVDLESLPAVIHNGPWLDPINVVFYNLYHLEVTGGSIALDEDDRFAFTLEGFVDADGNYFPRGSTLEGYYEVDGDELWLTPDGAPAIFATIEGRTITLTADIMRKGTANDFAFRR